MTRDEKPSMAYTVLSYLFIAFLLVGAGFAYFKVRRSCDSGHQIRGLLLLHSTSSPCPPRPPHPSLAHWLTCRRARWPVFWVAEALRWSCCFSSSSSAAPPATQAGAPPSCRSVRIQPLLRADCPQPHPILRILLSAVVAVILVIVMGRRALGDDLKSFKMFPAGIVAISAAVMVLVYSARVATLPKPKEQ